MAVVALVFLVLAACGGNGDGNSDTILTGFSGVIVFGIVAWVIWRYVRKKM